MASSTLPSWQEPALVNAEAVAVAADVVQQPAALPAQGVERRLSSRLLLQRNKETILPRLPRLQRLGPTTRSCWFTLSRTEANSPPQRRRGGAEAPGWCWSTNR